MRGNRLLSWVESITIEPAHWLEPFAYPHFLRDGPGPSTQMKVEFIDRHKQEHGVQPICDALKETNAAIAPSTYYAARTRPKSDRTIRDRELTEKITTIHAENYSVYGVRKVHTELQRQGLDKVRASNGPMDVFGSAR